MTASSPGRISDANISWMAWLAPLAKKISSTWIDCWLGGWDLIACVDEFHHSFA